MDAIDRLTAIEQIKQLKSRYFQAIDGKDWALLDTLYFDDVVCDCRGATTDPVSGINFVSAATDEILYGKAAAIAAARDGLAGIVSVHQGFMPDIEIIDADTARACWAMTDRLYLPEGAPFRGMIGYGHYRETYGRDGAHWRMKTMLLTRIRVETF